MEITSRNHFIRDKRENRRFNPTNTPQKRGSTINRCRPPYPGRHPPSPPRGAQRPPPRRPHFHRRRHPRPILRPPRHPERRVPRGRRRVRAHGDQLHH